MRIAKTVISATIIAILYSLIDRNPCFACIGAVYGLGNTFKGGRESGGNRFIGTLIGGLLSLPFYFLYHNQALHLPAWLYLSVGLFLVLYICKIFRVYGGIQPAAVVYFVVIYTVIQDRYITYVLARILDTGIGVVFSLFINRIFPSPLDKASRIAEDEKMIARLEHEVAELKHELEEEQK